MVARRRRKLAAARKAAGYTQEGLAEALHVDRSTVQRWEAGEHAPWPYLWPKLGRLLGLSREQLQALMMDEEVKARFAQAASVSQERDEQQAQVVTLLGSSGNAPQPVAELAGMAAPASATGISSGQGADAHQLTDYLRTWATDVNRRELIRLLGVAATDLAAPPMLAGLNSDEQERVVRVIAAPQRVDGQTIGHVEAVLYSAMYQDDALGPQAALDTVLAQRKLTGTLLADCQDSLRRRLLTLHSNLSRFAGWLSFDLGDFGTATYYYEQARLAAHEAENTNLSIFVLCNMSHLATWQGQPRVGIDHAIAAQNWAQDTDDLLLRAYSADVAARAYAAIGKQRACLDALDNAQAGVVDARTQTPATSLVYFYGPGQFSQTRSLCLLKLDQAEQAGHAAQESLELVNSAFVRNQAFSTIHLGNAYIAAGEIDEAARVIGDGAALAARNRSMRVLDMLGRARVSLREWQNTTAVRELDDKLVTYGLASNSTT